MGKMSVDTYLKIVFYSYMPSSGHFYFGLTDELSIRDFMLNHLQTNNSIVTIFREEI